MSDDPLAPDAPSGAPAQPPLGASPEPSPSSAPRPPEPEPPPGSGTRAAPRQGTPWLVPVIVGVAAVLLLCCAGAAVTGFFLVRADRDFTVTGDLTLSGAGGASDGTSCRGTGGYDDIDEGTDVVVSDAAGKTLAIGRLRAGTTKDGDCVFPFTVSRVPKSEKFYGVTISHRGTLNYTRQDLKEPLHLVI
jgi:hypothetical protein